MPAGYNGQKAVVGSTPSSNNTWTADGSNNPRTAAASSFLRINMKLKCALSCFVIFSIDYRYSYLANVITMLYFVI